MSEKNISYINYEATGANIKALMDNNGITTREMSNILGISFQAVHGYIHGTRLPTVGHLFMIAKIFDTTVDDLLVPNSYI